MYQYFSRLFFILILIVSSLMIWNSFMLTKEVKSNYNLYLRTESEYKNDGIDIDKALKSPVQTDQKQGANGNTIETIDNILRYDYENLTSSIYRIQPNQIVPSSLEWISFIFLPIIFMIYGVYIATYERKYKTLKIKSIQYDWRYFLITKQISLYISALIILTFSTLFSYIAGRFFYVIITKEIPMEQFQVLNAFADKNLFVQLIITLFITIIFSTLGFSLGIICKGILIPVLIFVAYNFATPILGTYDIRNMIAVLGHQAFNFSGNFKLFTPSDMPTTTAVLLLIGFILLLTIITYVTFGRQSKYMN